LVAKPETIDTVRASRAGHTFHERWAARRALQLVFPADDLYSITMEGLSEREKLPLNNEVEGIADLVLYYGDGDTFAECSAQQIAQFKYKVESKPASASYLQKTIRKFASTLRQFKESAKEDEVENKLSFSFVTNAKFSSDLWEAISQLKSPVGGVSRGAQRQIEYLEALCGSEGVTGGDLFKLIEFRASTMDLPAHNRDLRRTISDWSANSSGAAAKRLFALVELVREKAQVEGQGRNSIVREDVLDALECDEDQLFPADTRFVDVESVLERQTLMDAAHVVAANELPVFVYADGGVGKTVFIQSLAAHLSTSLEVVIFDCFGGGAYRSESQARHLPKVGLLQIVNELATRGLCDPLLPTDSDSYGLIEFTRKRLRQASETIRNQSASAGVLLIIDAADNAQLVADDRNEVAFPRLLLASLSSEPIEGVKLLLTARPYRKNEVTGDSQVIPFELQPFTDKEVRNFVEMRRKESKEVDFATAISRSQGNPRVLEYLLDSWTLNISGATDVSEITVEQLIDERCVKIFDDLHTAGWLKPDVRMLFGALAILPPPVPLSEMALALGWEVSQVNSAISDLAPMLEILKYGAIFRDEETENYIRSQYSNERDAQQSIARRLRANQQNSIYAAQALPHFLVVIGDSRLAYELASTEEYPSEIKSENGRRRLKLTRLRAAFSLANKEKELDVIMMLAMQLSQIASANARGDHFIQASPSLATILGDVDASRRLFTDRSGWRGARDGRVAIACSLLGESEEARIHQHRAIGWINWYLGSFEESGDPRRLDLEARDIAAVMFVSVVEGEFSFFNRNILNWQFSFALSVVDELIDLCSHLDIASDDHVLVNLADFAASKNCESLALQVGLLSKEWGLDREKLRSISRAASGLARQVDERLPAQDFDFELSAQIAISKAAMASLVVNTKHSAMQIGKLIRHRRATSYDFGEVHGLGRVWPLVQSECVKAWSAGEPLSYRHLIPENATGSRTTKHIVTEDKLSNYLLNLKVNSSKAKLNSKKALMLRTQFPPHEVERIVDAISCVLTLVKPIEKAVLGKLPVTNSILLEFLGLWKSVLRPNIHYRAELGRDNVARHVGFGLVEVLLRWVERIEENTAEELIEIVGSDNRLSAYQVRVLELIARRANLADVAGAYSNSLAAEFLKEEYTDQRGDSFRDLASALLPLSIEEARHYYSEGLAQLDQMGGEDYDLIYSTLRYAAEQSGGYAKPELSDRLMNLCQSIFKEEPEKFGWALFGRAASSSIGIPAIYKLIRWDEQGVLNLSYALPQLACSLAKAGSLDPRRAAVLLTACEDHGWHEWQVGDGVRDLMSVAKPNERQAIFFLVFQKLYGEHNFDGWEAGWQSLLDCHNSFDVAQEYGLASRLVDLRDKAKARREVLNKSDSSIHSSLSFGLKGPQKDLSKEVGEKALEELLSKTEPTSASSMDNALREIESNELLRFFGRRHLFEAMRDSCHYTNRVPFLEALCESTELEFSDVVTEISTSVKLWEANSAHVRDSKLRLIENLFRFKGSQLFELKYSGVSHQISRLSALSDQPKIVIQLVLDTIAKEGLELGGDDWLNVANSLCDHSSPPAALAALESLLSSSAGKSNNEAVVDELNEGQIPADNEDEVTADVIWYLLSDSNAHIRWRAARSLKGMLDVDLIEDIERLLDRFDQKTVLSFESSDRQFSFQNAQQWFLMGLSRAALHHAAKIIFLKPKLEELSKRQDLHVLNKLHIARCLTHIESAESSNSTAISRESIIRKPPHGLVIRSAVDDYGDRRIDFSFDYDFDRYKVSELARLFGISVNEASDCISSEVINRFPGSSGMSDFPGQVRYRQRSQDRFESHREQIQRNALTQAATTLVRSRPVVRESYDQDDWNPWQEFLAERDVSFDDGSWLADHKDDVPAEAQELLLSESTSYREELSGTDIIMRKIGLTANSRTGFLPLYGRWVSRDGVDVRFLSALTKFRGSVGYCQEFSKRPKSEIWLPMARSPEGYEPNTPSNRIETLICEPERYPIGIDQEDDWAAHNAISRPSLTPDFLNSLHLTRADERSWEDDRGLVVLESQIWGCWKAAPDAPGQTSADDGAILWARRDWLDEVLNSCDRSLIYTVNFAKYQSAISHKESSRISEVYVGLLRSERDMRFWHAKASKRSH